MTEAASSVLVGGDWRSSGHLIDVLNPANLDEVVGTAGWATVADVQDAGAAAASAFSTWRRSSAAERADLLQRVADRLEAGAAELARLIVCEQGKTLGEAAGEVERSVGTLRYFAGRSYDPQGDVLPSIRPGALTVARRVPRGPVALLTPFNFPVLVPCWKLGPALAYGNTVIWKPSELTSLTAAAVCAAFVESGAPPGVVNLVPGGAEVGRAVVDLPQVRAISFTGSTVVGREIERAVAGRDVGVQLEMGGKNPGIVLPDADLTVAARHILQGSFGGAGQRCTALSRLLVPADREDAFLECLVDVGSAWTTGNGLDPSATAGPVVSDAARRRADDMVAAAVAAGGATEHIGRLDASTPGHWVHPTVVRGIGPRERLAVEEVFAPVTALLPYQSVEEAVAIANDTTFGLNASVFTGDLDAALHVLDDLDVGMVQVNADAGVAFHVPFVGRGDSGAGPAEQGTWARDFYTRPQVANLHPARGAGRR